MVTAAGLRPEGPMPWAKANTSGLVILSGGLLGMRNKRLVCL